MNANLEDNPKFDFYVSRPQVRAVEFAVAAGSISTLEGPVQYAAGDAIVTGSHGEQWPIPRAAFAEKYRAQPGTQQGAAGHYEKLPTIIRGLQASEPFAVTLSAGRGVLRGAAGDWRIAYAQGDEAVVAPAIFQETYRAVGVPVDMALLDECDTPSLRAEINKLRELLRNTAIRVRVVTRAEISANTDLSLWCLIQNEPPPRQAPIPAVLTIAAATVLGSAKSKALTHAVEELQKADRSNWLVYSTKKIAALAYVLARPQSAREINETLMALAEQLIAVERFNADLHSYHRGEITTTPANYMTEYEPTSDCTHYLWEVGALADQQANIFQRCWQDVLFGQTKLIAQQRRGLRLIFYWPVGLIQLGVLAALALAGYTELASGCVAEDPFAAMGCTSSFWKNYVGHGLFIVYLLTLIYAWFVLAKAKLKKWEILHQDYRLLAECLRVQYLWSVMGTDRNLAEDLPPAAHSGSGWVVNALCTLKRRAALVDVSIPANVGALWGQRHFVEHQIGYHEHTLIARREQAIERVSYFGRWGALLFLAMIVVFSANTVIELYSGHHVFSEMGHHGAIIVMVLFVAIWAAMRKVIESYGWETEAQRGELVLSELYKAKRIIDGELKKAERNIETIRRALTQCGSFFARDQAAWHALRRAKPIEATSGA